MKSDGHVIGNHSWSHPVLSKLSLDEAKKQNLFSGKSPILFIDEIHRFNKSQQDSLLHAVEKGWIVLIGATTENPSFEVVSALLSRSQVYILKALTFEKLEELGYGDLIPHFEK